MDRMDRSEEEGAVSGADTVVIDFVKLGSLL
jgi:hypothetical protein